MNLAVMLLLFLLVGGCIQAPPDNGVTVVYASPYPPGHPFSQADQEWMEYVEQRSGGEIKILPNWSGALISSEHSMVELRHGVADIGLITPIYVKGGAHLIRVQSGFYSGVDTIENQVSLYRCLEASIPEFGRELDGLKILAVQGGSLPGVLTTERPVRRLDDLTGLRIRAPTELLNVLRQLGADPVNMPMGEVYSALAKGIIDGVVAPADTLLALHFAEVTKFYSDLKIPRGAYPARAMNLNRWEALSEEHQQILEEGIQIWEASLASGNRAAYETGWIAGEKSGIEFIRLPDRDQQRFDELYLELARQNAKSLDRYGIDGLSVFNEARASINRNGDISCRRSGI